MTAMMLSLAVSSVILWASRCQGNRTLVNRWVDIVIVAIISTAVRLP
jgi:hypothetical protein